MCLHLLDLSLVGDYGRELRGILRYRTNVEGDIEQEYIVEHDLEVICTCPQPMSSLWLLLTTPIGAISCTCIHIACVMSGSLHFVNNYKNGFPGRGTNEEDQSHLFNVSNVLEHAPCPFLCGMT